MWSNQGKLTEIHRKCHTNPYSSRPPNFCRTTQIHTNAMNPEKRWSKDITKYKHALFQEESTSKKHAFSPHPRKQPLFNCEANDREIAARIARDPAGLVGAEGVAHLVRWGWQTPYVCWVKTIKKRWKWWENTWTMNEQLQIWRVHCHPHYDP